MRALLLVLVTTALALPAAAGRPFVRRLTSDQGLVLGEVHTLAHDAQNMVWIGGYGGVSRWDGVRVEQMDGGRIPEPVERVLLLGDGEVVALGQFGGGVYRIDGERTAPLPGPAGQVIAASAASVDPWGRLLLVIDDAVWRLRDGHWELLRQHPALRGSHFVFHAPDGVRVIRHRDLWAVPAVRGPVRRVWHAPSWVEAAWPTARGTLWLAGDLGEARELTLDGDVLREEHAPKRIRGVAEDRDGNLWLGTGIILVRVAPDGRRDVFTEAEHGVNSGGTLHVDAENSVWLGGYDGVRQIAAPDVRTWTTLEGLETNLTRRVRVVGERVLLTTWALPEVVDAGSGEVTLLEEARGAKSWMCPDDRGVVWTNNVEGEGRGHLLGLDGDAVVERVEVDLFTGYDQACATGPAGAVWFTSRHRLWRVRRGDVPRSWALPSGYPPFGRALHVDPDGTLVLVLRNVACTSRVARLLEGEEAWSCTRVTDRPGDVVSLVRSEAGRLWAAGNSGVHVQAPDGTWSPVPGLSTRGSGILPAVAPASEGGLWVGGQGTLLRLRDRPDLPAQHEVIQDLTAWLGPQVATIGGLAEDAHGTLWIAHTGGVTSVPRGDQHPDLAPPPIAISEVRVDGVPAEGTLDLPASSSVVRARVTAPSHRAPRLLRFRSRVDDRAWSEPVEDGIFELQGLSAGPHVLQVAASMDGERWSTPPARIAVVVPVSWYARPELWLVAVVVVGAIVLVVERLRSDVALRMERLRTRIAMDLHDEVGAGLGAVGLLGSVLRRDLEPAAVRSLGDDIVETSTELSQGLRAIVWSLQPSSQTLGELGDYLADRARMILAGHEVDIDIDADAHRETVALDVLRAAQLVGLEALHNVARHAEAGRARLRIERHAGRWLLVVEDDGVGLGEGQSERIGEGLGLAGMRRRATEVGADLELGVGALGGARVVLRLPRRRRMLR